MVLVWSGAVEKLSTPNSRISLVNLILNETTVWNQRQPKSRS